MTTPSLPPAKFEPVEVPGQVAKALVGFGSAVLAVLVIAFQDDHLDALDLANVAIQGLVAFGVWLVPLVATRYRLPVKTVIAVVGTALQAAVPFITTGTITTQQWLIVLVAAIGSVAVGVTPNSPPPARVEAAADGSYDVSTLPSR